ncbi:MAG TPA: O-antigen ligase family protein [Firmicutes bacterium]|jgi:O-antigen ligase|nr:O-antigen ligase family protein [Bacillota bacterium]
MQKPHRDAVWGFLAPISPLFVLAYFAWLARRFKLIAESFLHDKATLYAFIGMIISGVLSASRAPDPRDGFIVMWVLVIFIGMYALGRWGVEKPKAFVQALVFGSGFLGIVVFIAYTMRLNIHIGSIPILVGLRRGNVLGMAANGLAALMEAGVVGGIGLAIYRAEYRLHNIAASFLSLIGVFCTVSRGGMVAIAVSAALLLALSWKVWKRFLPYAVAVVLLVGVVVATWPNLDRRIVSIAQPEHHKVRLQIYRGIVSMVADHPLLGVGPGNFTTVFPQYQLPEQEVWATTPHNIYFYVLTGWGLLGFTIFFGWIFLTVVVPLWRKFSPWRCIVFTMMLTFWSHVLFDDLFIAHIPILMGLVARPELDAAVDEETEGKRTEVGAEQGVPATG